MTLPRGDEYYSAVQNPRIAFSDADLKNSVAEVTPLGLPKPYSGGFTITYKLINQQKNWAVRCFHRDIQDLQRRYSAIGTFLAKNQSKYFVPASYLQNGIKVNGVEYPIIKMQWLEGEPLNIYLSKNYNQKSKLEKLLIDFTNLVNELQKYGIAHGDLQHGNILVKNDNLFLIDYDGMYFPELSTLKTNEIGHINYQHPRRTSDYYNSKIDRFSAIIIYVGLKALTLEPGLWKKYDNSENILFKSQDFANLSSSALIQELSAIIELRPFIERLVGCCYLPFDNIPSLNEFLTGNFSYNKNATGSILITRSQYLILDARNSERILEHFGEKIEVVGKISTARNNLTRYGDPYVFLNFGIYPSQTFTIVIWQEGVASLQAKGISPSSLVGKWVSVTGVISSYGDKPQTIVDLPNQIAILNSEAEAIERIKFKGVKKSGDKEVDVFNGLYGALPASPKPTPPSKPETPKPNPPPKPITPPKPTPTPAPITPPKRPPPTKPIAPPKPAPTPKPITPPKPTPSSNVPTESTNYWGCLIPIVLVIIGAAVAERMWLFGAIVGGMIGMGILNYINKNK